MTEDESYYSTTQFMHKLSNESLNLVTDISYEVSFLNETFTVIGRYAGELEFTLSNGARITIDPMYSVNNYGAIYSSEGDGLTRPFTTRLTIKKSESIETIHTIDPKYIEDMYHTSSEIVVEESTFNFDPMEVDGSDITYYVYNDNNEHTWADYKSTYTVVWDGVEYKNLEPQWLNNNTFVFGTTYASDPSAMNFEDIPFCICANPNYFFMVTNEQTSSHAISIIKNVPHPIDKKYLPSDCQTITKIDHELSAEEFMQLPDGYYNFSISIDLYDMNRLENENVSLDTFVENYSDYICSSDVLGFMYLVSYNEGVKDVCFYDYGVMGKIVLTSYMGVSVDMLEPKLLMYHYASNGFGYYEAQNFLGYDKETLETEAQTVIGAINEVNTSIDNLSQTFILNSSTEGSSKRFQITVDDSGTISATEITT